MKLPKELKSVKKFGKVATPFLGGALFATAGVSALTSRPAKKIYAHVLAASMKAKDTIDTELSQIKQVSDDVLAEAQEIYQADKAEQQLADLNLAEEDPVLENQDHDA